MTEYEETEPTIPGYATPLTAGSGPVGIVFSHGFTGSPWPMKPWAAGLASKGYRVSVPLLPGHGTNWRNLNKTTWVDWYNELERAFDDLARECNVVFAAGLSMGGALALRLAQQRQSAVAGVMLVNPALALSGWHMRLLPLLAKFKSSSPALGGDICKPNVTDHAYRRTPLRAAASMLDLWDETNRGLPRVRHPLLIFRSRADHVIDATSLRLIVERSSASEITVVDLPNSYHVATLDHDGERIIDKSEEWLKGITLAAGALVRVEGFPAQNHHAKQVSTHTRQRDVTTGLTLLVAGIAHHGPDFCRD